MLAVVTACEVRRIDRALLFALVVANGAAGIGCNLGAESLGPTSAGADATANSPPDAGPARSSLDAGAPVADDAQLPLECEAGFEPDEQGRCAKWMRLTSGAPACFDVSMATLHNGEVLVAGNCHDPAAPEPQLLSGFIFEPDTGAWRLLLEAPPARRGSTMTILSDGRVLIVGGASYDAVPRTSTAATLFDSETARFEPTSGMTMSRVAHAATKLLDGRVLVTGGFTRLTADGQGNEITASVEIYDPRMARWQAQASMRTARHGHTATLLDNGKVVVIGGVDAFGVSSSVEIYDPTRDRWHDGPSLEALTGNDTVTLLPDGSVLVLGGASALRSFSGVTGFLPAAPIQTPRQGHVAIELDPGVILIVGGISSEGEVPRHSELYDAFTDSWTETLAPGVSIWSRSASNATRVQNGVFLHSDNVGFLVYSRPPLRW